MRPPAVILTLHRYLGVVVGLLMTVWCLSGFVMMVQAFPETTDEERLAGLQPLDRPAAAFPPLPDDLRVDYFALEQLAGKPVLRLATDEGALIYDVSAGAPLGPFTPAEAQAVALDYARGHGLSPDVSVARILRDQWTVQLARRHQPLYRVSFADPAGTVIYVSGKTGEVIQDTTRKERILAWLGAVPHWLYPTLLRQHPDLWTQIVIWGSVLGLFLTATGLYVGALRWLGRPPGRATPYRGLWAWHHLTGLVFGALTLTWTLSGLLSMNPWGLLEGGASPASQIRGSLTFAQVRAALAQPAPHGTVRLEAAALGDAPYVLAVKGDGSTVRLLHGREAPVSRAQIAGALAPLEATFDLERLQAEDAYYYGHHQAVRLPVWRVTLQDAQATRIYIDAETGSIVRVVDAAARQSRWWHSALHSLDLPGVRARPIWYAVAGTLLAGVTLCVALGTWMAWRRVRLDFRILRKTVTGSNNS